MDRRTDADTATQGGVAFPGDGVECPLVRDVAFFRRAIVAVNEIVGQGLGPRWKPRRVGAAATQAVAFFGDREVKGR